MGLVDDGMQAFVTPLVAGNETMLNGVVWVGCVCNGLQRVDQLQRMCRVNDK